MEIERKFLIKKENLPENLASYPCHRIEQGYLCTSPVVRIRRQDDDYFLTYKSKGLMSREEYNLPLNEESFTHLKEKIDEIDENAFVIVGDAREVHGEGFIEK